MCMGYQERLHITSCNSFRLVKLLLETTTAPLLCAKRKNQSRDGDNDRPDRRSGLQRFQAESRPFSAWITSGSSIGVRIPLRRWSIVVTTLLAMEHFLIEGSFFVTHLLVPFQCTCPKNPGLTFDDQPVPRQAGAFDGWGRWSRSGVSALRSTTFHRSTSRATVDVPSTVGGVGHGRDVSRFTDSLRQECAPAVLVGTSSRPADAGHVAASLRRSERAFVEFAVLGPS